MVFQRGWNFRISPLGLLRSLTRFALQVSDYSNRVANVFHTHGYKHGDVVGLLLENRPEFVATWLGLSKLGIIIPLINHNLRKNALVHSITVAKCNALILGESLREAVSEITESLPSSLALYQFNDAPQQAVMANAKDLTTLMQDASKELPTANVKKADHHDKLLYIYTSGTTGLPKAAVITHSRYEELDDQFPTTVFLSRGCISDSSSLRQLSTWWPVSEAMTSSTLHCHCITRPAA